MELLLDMVLGISISMGIGLLWLYLARQRSRPEESVPQDEAAVAVGFQPLDQWDWDEEDLPTVEEVVPVLRDEMPPVRDLPALPVEEPSARRLRGELRERAQRIDELERTVDSLATRFRSCVGRDPESLQNLRGIGPRYEAALAEQGIGTVTQLAGMSVEDHRRLKREAPALYRRLCGKRWVEQAKALLRGAPVAVG